jgi:3-hydroxy-D-aspartate aldolase
VECYNKLSNLKHKLVSIGIEVEIVSGGGSCTYKYACKNSDITELQAGTYLFNDMTFQEKVIPEFECALTVMSTVVSKKNRPGFENMAVIDLGSKCISLNYGFPEIKSVEGKVLKVSQEHSRIDTVSDANLKTGDKVEVFVRDSNETFNLYSYIFLSRGDKIVGVVDINNHGQTI